MRVTRAALHTCAITLEGAAWCWGANNWGQLGDGTTINRAVPVPVAGGLTFAQISAAELANGDPTCALTVAGVAYCWGYQGNGSTIDSPEAVTGGLTLTRVSHVVLSRATVRRFCFDPRADGLVPLAVAPGLTFTDLAVAGSRSWGPICGLVAGGVVYRWGAVADDVYGRAVVVAPTALSGGLTFASLAAYDSDHMCGITTDGVAYCWDLGGSPNKLWGQR